MKKYELEYLKELAEENKVLNTMLKNRNKIKGILERRVVKALKHNLKYYKAESLEDLLNGPGFPFDELIVILNIDVREVEEAIEQQKREAKEESE